MSRFTSFWPTYACTIPAPDNQLGPMSWFFLKSNNQLECLESGWSKLCSLRNQYRHWLDNQLERAIIERGWLDDSVVPVRNHLEYPAWIIFIGNGHINQLKDGKRFDTLFKCQCHWDVKLQRTFNCGIVIWDRTLLCRAVICWAFREFICDGYNNQLERGGRLVIEG